MEDENKPADEAQPPPENPPPTDPENPPATDPENPPTTDPENPPATNPENPPATIPENPPATDPEKPPVTDPEKASDEKPEEPKTTNPPVAAEEGKANEGGKKLPLKTPSLIIGVLLAVVGGAFQFGYNISVLNAPTEEILYNFYPCDKVNTTVKSCDDDEENKRTTIYAVITAAFPFAAIIGSMLVSTVMHNFGRRDGMLFNLIFSLFAAILFGSSKAIGFIWMIFVGRIFVGIYAGLAAGLVPTYISEISPKQWRGAIGVLNQLFITIGILFAQIMGLEGALGSSSLWPVLLAFTFLPSLFLLFGGYFIPNSPRYLLLDNRNEKAAEKTLIKLRGTDDVKEEMEEMKAEKEMASKTKSLTVVELLKEKSVRWQLITIIVMHLCQQLGGINAVFFYTNKIFNAAQIPKGRPQDLASIAIGSVNVAMTIISFLIIERVGRKKLIVYGFASMVLSCILLTVILSVLESSGGSSGVSSLSILFVVFYIVGFAVGPGPVPWLLNAELFTQEWRPAATTVGCMVNWSSNFLLSIIFPSLVSAMGAYVFIIFMVVSLIATLYLQLILPETKGKTYNEIYQMFAKRNGVVVSATSAVEPSNPLTEEETV